MLVFVFVFSIGRGWVLFVVAGRVDLRCYEGLDWLTEPRCATMDWRRVESEESCLTMWIVSALMAIAIVSPIQNRHHCVLYS